MDRNQKLEEPDQGLRVTITKELSYQRLYKRERAAILLNINHFPEKRVWTNPVSWHPLGREMSPEKCPINSGEKRRHEMAPPSTIVFSETTSMKVNGSVCVCVCVCVFFLSTITSHS